MAVYSSKEELKKANASDYASKNKYASDNTKVFNSADELKAYRDADYQAKYDAFAKQKKQQDTFKAKYNTNAFQSAVNMINSNKFNQSTYDAFKKEHDAAKFDTKYDDDYDKELQSGWKQYYNNVLKAIDQFKTDVDKAGGEEEYSKLIEASKITDVDAYAKSLDELKAKEDEARKAYKKSNGLFGGNNPAFASGFSAATNYDVGNSDEYERLKAERERQEDILAKAKGIKAGEIDSNYDGQRYSDVLNAMSTMDRNSFEYQYLDANKDRYKTEEDYERDVYAAAGEYRKAKDAYDAVADRESNAYGANALSGADGTSPEERRLIKAEENLKAAKARQRDYFTGKEYESLQNNEDFAEKSKATGATAIFGLTGNEAYAIINDIDGARGKYIANRGKAGGNAQYDRLIQMTDDEVMTYNYLLNDGGGDAAKKYIQFITPQLDARNADEENARYAEFASEHPGTASIASVASNIGSGLGFIDVAAQNVANAFRSDENYKQINYNTPLMGASRMTNTIRGTVAENIADEYGRIQINPDKNPFFAKILNGKSLGDVYQLGMSVADSFVTAGFSKMGIKNATAILGGAAASSALTEAVANGASDSEALAIGLCYGINEMLFEELSIEKLMEDKVGESMIKSLLKQGFTEGSEEIATSAANLLSNAIIMQDKNDIRLAAQQMMDEARANGQNLSEEEALRKAWQDFGVSILWDGIGGALSGMASGAISNVGQNAIHNITPYEGATDNVRDYIAALESIENPTNASQSAISNAQAKLDNGSTIRNKDVDRLRNAYSSNVEQNVRAAAEESLKDSKRPDVKNTARLATEEATGKRKTTYGPTINADTERARQAAYNSYSQQTIKTAVDVETSRAARKNADAPQNFTVKATDKNGQSVEITSVSESRVTVKDTDGNVRTVKAEELNLDKDTENAVKIMQDRFGRDTAVIYSAYNATKDSVPFDQFVTAADAMYSVSQKADMPLEEAKGLLQKNYPTLAKSLNDAQAEAIWESARNSAAVDVFRQNLTEDDIKEQQDRISEMGKGSSSLEVAMKSPYAVGLTEEEIRTAWEQGRQARDTKTADKKSNITTVDNRKHTSGKVTLSGVNGRDLDRAFEKKNNKRNYNWKQGTAKKYFDMVSEVTGWNIVLYKTSGETVTDDKGRKVFKEAAGFINSGDYSDNTIYIAINAGLYSEEDIGDIAKYTLIDTFTHELVHQSQKWNGDEYTSFKEFVLNELDKKTDSESLINNVMNTQGLDYDAAADEVVAQAMVKMLEQSDVMEQLAEEQPTVFKRILQALKEFAQKLKEYFKDGGVNTTEAMLLRENGKYIDEMVNRFDSLVKGAVHNYQSSAQAIADSKLSESEILERTQAEIKKQIEEDSPEIEEALGGIGEVKTTENGDIGIVESEDGKSIVCNKRTYNDGGRSLLESTLKNNGFSKDDISNALSFMDNIVEFLDNIATDDKRLNASLNQNITVTRKNGRLVAVLHTLTTNGDYPVNFDLSTICKKRVAYQRVLNNLLQSGDFQNIAFNAEAIAKINEILARDGFEVACAACFVEARRTQIQAWAETYADKWNAEVDKRNKDAGYFGFASGKALLTEDEILKLHAEMSDKEKNNKGNLNLGKGDVQSKMGKLMDYVPTLVRHITAEDILLPQGLTELRKLDSNMLSLLKQLYGANSPKITQEFEPYQGDAANLSFDYIRKINGEGVVGGKNYVKQVVKEWNAKLPAKVKGKSGKMVENKNLYKQTSPEVQKEALRRYLYDIGGARSQSFSDFIIENVLDKLQLMADMAAQQLPMHEYTKEISSARIFGMTGLKENMSVIHHIDPKVGKAYAGLSKNENGEYVLVADDYANNKRTNGKSRIQSIGYKDAVALQLDPRYSANCGTIAIGFSIRHILNMLDDNNIRMVIPYHKSGLPPIFAEMTNVAWATDFTKHQNTKVKEVRDLNNNVIRYNSDTMKVDTSFNYNSVLQETGDARLAAKKYIEWCAAEHPVYATVDGKKKVIGHATFSPKFSDCIGAYNEDGSEIVYDFTTHKNYYKLLEDFNTYDCITNKPAPQGDVKMTYPGMDEATTLTSKQLAEYRERLEKAGLYTAEEIDKYVAIAKKSYKDLIRDELAFRKSFNDEQDKKFASTMDDIRDTLTKFFPSTPEARREERRKKEEEEKKKKAAKDKIQKQTRSVDDILTADNKFKTVSEVRVTDLQEAFNRLNADAVNAKLGDKVFKTLEMMRRRDSLSGNAHQISFVSGEEFDSLFPKYRGAAGLYVTPINSAPSIYYNIDKLNKAKSITAANLILHEAIHGATMGSVMDAVYTIEDEEVKTGVEAIKDNTSGYLAGGLMLVDVYRNLKRNYNEAVKKYGMTNAVEMVAELSNPQFRAFLKKQSVGEDVKNAVRRIFGIKRETAYGAVSVALDKMLDSMYESTVRWGEAEAERNGKEWNTDIKYQGRGNGYSGYSMSNNAVSAYENGEMPKTKWTKSAIIEQIENIEGISPQMLDRLKSLTLVQLRDNFLEQTSWHHTSKMYNKTDFYSVDAEKIQSLTDQDIDDIAGSKIAAKQSTIKKGTFMYDEWTGTKSRPKKISHTLENVDIEERGSFYVVSKDGEEIIRKKIGSNGTVVRYNEDIEREEEQRRGAKERLAQRKANSSDAAIAFIDSNDVQFSSSGHGYLPGRKPNRWQYDNGLQDYFKVGEQRIATDFDKNKYILQTWDGTKWVSETEIKNQVRTPYLTDNEVIATAADILGENNLSKAQKDAISIYTKRLDTLQSLEADLNKVYADNKGHITKAVRAKIDSLRKQITEAEAALYKAKDSAPIKSVLSRVRNKQIVDTEKAVKKAVSDTKKTMYFRKRILDIKKQADTMLKNPKHTVRGYVPVELVKAVSEMCDTITDSLLLRANTVGIGKGKQSMNARHQLLLLKEQYQMLAEDADYDYIYDGVVKDALDTVTAVSAQKDIYRMTPDELELLYNAMSAVMTTVYNANKVTAAEETRTLSEIKDKFIDDINDVTPKKNIPAEKYLMMQMRPDTFFQYICGYAKGNAGETVQQWFTNGTERMLDVERQFYYHFQEFTEPKNAEDRKEFQDLVDNPLKNKTNWGLKNSNGETIETSRGMMLNAYQLLSQQDSYDSLLYGGFSIPRQEVYYQGKVVESYGKQGEGEVQSLRFGEELTRLARELKKAKSQGDTAGADIIQDEIDALMIEGTEYLNELKQNIEAQLTPYEQRLLAATDDWYQHTGDMLSDLFLKMYGFKPKRAAKYAPIHRDTSTITIDMRTSGIEQVNLENAGFTKARVKSVAPILLSDFFYDLDTQQKRFARYYGFVQVQHDFNRIYNMKKPGSTETLKGVIGNKFGRGNGALPSGQGYIENYIKSVSGANYSDPSIFTPFYGAAARASLTLNPRVAVSQLASIPTAAAAIGWDAVGKGLARGIKTAFSTKAKQELAEKSVWFWQRYRGEGGMREFADIKDSRGMLGNLWSKAERTKIGSALLNWCQDMDVLATASMWAMAEEYVKKHDGSVEEVYRDIIRKTQPNYTDTERSDLLRNKSEVMKILTMYKTQSNQNLNILIEANGKFNKFKRDMRDGKNGVTPADVKAAGKELANAYTAVILGGSVTFAVLRGLANVVLGSLNAYRDDDDELTTKSVLKGLGEEIASSLAGMFMFGSEVYDFASAKISGSKYYGISDSAISALSDLAITTSDTITAIAKGEVDWNIINSQLRDTAQILGIPYNNVEKFFKAGKMIYEDAVNGTFGQFEGGIERTSAQNFNRFINAFEAGDTEKANSIFNQFYTEQLENEATEWKALEKIQSKIADKAKTWFTDGTVSEDSIRRLLKDYASMSDDDISSLITEWQGEIDTGMSYSDFRKSYIRNEVSEDALRDYLATYKLMSEDDIDDIVMNLNCEKETGYAYSDLEAAFVDKALDKEEVIQYRMKYGDYDREQAEETVTRWECERDTGIKYSEIEDEFKKGKITQDDVAGLLDIYGGYEPERADDYADKYAFNKQYPEYDGMLNVDQVKDYRTVENALDPGTFMDFLTYKNETPADHDENGKTIAYSKAIKIAEYIKAMGVDRETGITLFYLYNSKPGKQSLQILYDTCGY